jgi:hypothetical protein
MISVLTLNLKVQSKAIAHVKYDFLPASWIVLPHLVTPTFLLPLLLTCAHHWHQPQLPATTTVEHWHFNHSQIPWYHLLSLVTGSIHGAKASLSFPIEVIYHSRYGLRLGVEQIWIKFWFFQLFNMRICIFLIISECFASCVKKGDEFLLLRLLWRWGVVVLQGCAWEANFKQIYQMSL